jgi:uncharacterized membrane protein YjjP (DUF1212 family)
MPFPVLAGLPWLAGVITSLLTAAITFFTTYISKRLAVVLVGIAAIATLTAAFAAAIAALQSGLSVALPDQFTVALSWVIPTNFNACASACLSAKTLRWVYEWNIKIIQMKLL